MAFESVETAQVRGLGPVTAAQAVVPGQLFVVLYSTWTDPSALPKDNGANCYNCHQIDKKEISYGTIGPSLWNYGKLRGVKDVTDPAAAPIVQYTWSKLWNSKAYAACSNMPRFGHMGLLDEDQLRHVMALLLDPKSPVNQ